MKLLRWLIPLALLITAAVYFISARASATGEVPKRVRELGGGASNLFSRPEHVEIYKVDQPAEGKFPFPIEAVGPANLGEHMTPPADWVDRFRKWSIKPDADYATLCMPIPGFVVRFSRGNEAFDFLICLKCGQVGTTWPGQRPTNWVDIGDKRGVIELLAEAFPKDPDLKEYVEAYQKAPRS